MGNKKMQNISTVKVNPYEIAKAPDMDFGFKNILANASILADRFFGYHSPLPFTHSTLGDILQDRDRKDFIIGGGLIPDGNQMLRPLPIVAFSNYGGLFISNGLDVENRPYQIPLGVDFENEGWRIESIYIGNAFDDEKIQGEQPSQKKDPNWDEYASEWRASYRIGNTSEDTVFSEFKKRQMQAVRFYVYPGDIEDNKKDATAADTSALEVFKNRVKIAEVLVHCVLDSGNFPRIQPVTKDDIRFVTAVQYWEGKVGNTINPNDIDNYSGSNPTAVGEDNKWVQKAPTVEPNYQPGATVEEREKARLEAEQKTLNNRAYRAEHYNYRWTNEQTRTYRIGSIAEVSERLYKIHQSDGTLKEGVVWHKHINLTSENANSLRGELIPLGRPGHDTELAYGQKIISHENITAGLLKTATVLKEHINRMEDIHGATSSPEADRIAIRDNAGRFEVEDPVTDKQVVNISYLNNTFRVDVLMKLLMTKYITNQQEFSTWVSQVGNKAYTHVILEGTFGCGGTIRLKTIGTKEVISRGEVNIDVYISSDSSSVEAGIDGDGEASVSGVNLTVKGRCTQYNRVIGLKQCSCTRCKAVVVGADGEKGAENNNGKNGSHGASAYGFWDCTLDNCQADVTGGNGGDGGTATYVWELFGCTSGGRGGDGGNGGSAYSVQGCSFITPFASESVYGGHGGKGGNGGPGQCAGQKGGNGGNGGDGGNAYVLNYNNGERGHKGKQGLAGWVWMAKKGSDGIDGVDGSIIII